MSHGINLEALPQEQHHSLFLRLSANNEILNSELKSEIFVVKNCHCHNVKVLNFNTKM